ncbi:type II secretion system protein E [Carboxydothermus pertinax]|uniref:Type II secretion system protein E n=2 Tax=Carboxydothermus pertinax TaxID=870242 RepID=A0A1L8CVM3_9THEO|nr:type II secretion system protein E [Carboxydothermus pertinax]
MFCMNEKKDGKKIKRLGDFLVENGLITEEQLQKALEYQKRSGERLGQALVKLGYVTEQDIMGVLEFQLGIPQVALYNYSLNPALIKSIPESLIKRHKVIPLKREGNRLTVAMADPLNVVAIDDLRLATNLDIVPVIASEKEIDAVINRFFGAIDLNETIKDIEKVSGEEPEVLKNEEVEEVLVDEAPVVRVVNSLLLQAVNQRASDIHIEPFEDMVRVRFRVDGFLREIMTLPRAIRSSLTSRIKIMANMNITEKRLPQDGRIKIKVANRQVDMRVATTPTLFGEKVVIRLLDQENALLTLDKLGLSNKNWERLNKILSLPYGMILIAGPTGSGKTTTLYAALNQIHDPSKNIITIEDPVEYVMPGVTQIQVNPKAGLTFAVGLRSILRLDPDIIMVGEIRDKETAEIGVKAANTGHLVLSTIHTNDAVSTVGRLVEMGIEPYMVAASLLGVVAQRLVRKLCQDCKVPTDIGPDDPAYHALNLGQGEPVTVYRPVGCPACEHTGYKGRVGIHEVLINSKKVRNLIVNGGSYDDMLRVAREEGMVLMLEDGKEKVLAGITSPEEIIRVASTVS